jgi:hypothetical protein
MHTTNPLFSSRFSIFIFIFIFQIKKKKDDFYFYLLFNFHYGVANNAKEERIISFILLSSI